LLSIQIAKRRRQVKALLLRCCRQRNSLLSSQERSTNDLKLLPLGPVRKPADLVADNHRLCGQTNRDQKKAN
jgi:hypothetical protein